MTEQCTIEAKSFSCSVALISMVMILISTLCPAYAGNLDPYEDVIASGYLSNAVPNKQRKFYVINTSFLKYGKAAMNFFVKINGEKNYFYSETYEPESGGCYSEERLEYLKKDWGDSIKNERAYIANYAVKSDLNGDQKEDIILVITEQICKTHRFTSRVFLLRPEKEKVVIKELKGE